MNELILLGILVFHWLGDFVFQSDKDAKGKSTKIQCLFSHTMTYSLIMWIFFISIFTFNPNRVSQYFVCLAWLITLSSHTLIDFYTSKLNSKLWVSGNMHYFFVSIGFDQILHYIQLYLTVKYLL